MMLRVTGLNLELNIPPSKIPQFDEWIEKWVKIGFSTEEADFEEATEAALRTYDIYNIPRPKAVLRLSSPWAAEVAGKLAIKLISKQPSSDLIPWMGNALLYIPPFLYRQAGLDVPSLSSLERLGSSIVRRSEYILSDMEFMAKTSDNLWMSESSWALRIRSEIERRVETQLEKHFFSESEFQNSSKAEAEILSQVVSQLSFQLDYPVSTKDIPEPDRSNFRPTHNFRNAPPVGWGAYISYFRDILGCTSPVLERFELDEILLRSCGGVGWHTDIIVISDRPSHIHLDGQGRVHNDSGPAVKYRDGWSIWSWHGVQVPKYVIEDPEKITCEKIQSEPNSEVRRVLIERYGHELFIRNSKSVLVSEDKFGKLWLTEFASGKPLVMVEVVNSSSEPDGSFKTYFLHVPPEVKTAKEAVAWTFGMTSDQYHTDFES